MQLGDAPLTSAATSLSLVFGSLFSLDDRSCSWLPAPPLPPWAIARYKGLHQHPLDAPTTAGCPRLDVRLCLSFPVL